MTQIAGERKVRCHIGAVDFYHPMANCIRASVKVLD
jgi:hypothetical protein